MSWKANYEHKMPATTNFENEQIEHELIQNLTDKTDFTYFLWSIRDYEEGYLV